MDISHYNSSGTIMVAVDCIIFGFDGKQLQALLIRRGFEPQKGRWSLMGGFVQKNESIDEAAARVLNQLTGLSDIYMEQLYSFGEVERDAAGRVISVAYYALINIENYSEQLKAEHEAKWFPLHEIPSLIFDHQDMLNTAHERLKQKVAIQPIGFELLPHRFTLPQLQNLYEAIYERTLDKRNFRQKMLSLGILNKQKEKDKESSRKGAFYYVFDRLKYRKLQHEGLRLV